MLSNDWNFKQGENSRQEHCFQHFHSDGYNGFLNDVTTTLIEKADPSHHKKEKNFQWEL